MRWLRTGSTSRHPSNAEMESEQMSITTNEVRTIWAKAYSYASFRAFVRVLRVATAVGISTFLATLIPALQQEPTIGGVPAIALLLIFADKYLRDAHVY